MPTYKYKYPIRPARNPYTGRHAAGYRFRFNLRSISHHPLFLPLEMKNLPQIQQLLQGVSPLEVFKTSDIHYARRAFNEFRKAYDFPYWAVTEYFVRDIDDPDQIVPLWLYSYQHKIIDIFLKRYFEKKDGRYIITKTFPKCGVTTVVQAYILWQQIYVWPKHSNTCAASDINLNPIKTNLCRFLKRDIVPPDKSIFLPKADGHRAFFNTYRTPDALRGIDFGYVHFANMSLWHDSDGNLTSRVRGASFSGVLPTYKTLIVMEGNIPKPNHISLDDKRFSQYGAHPSDFRHICNNPNFLMEASYTHRHPDRTVFLHIPL